MEQGEANSSLFGELYFQLPIYCEAFSLHLQQQIACKCPELSKPTRSVEAAGSVSGSRGPSGAPDKSAQHLSPSQCCHQSPSQCCHQPPVDKVR